MTAHPRLPGLLADGEPLTDTAASWPVVSTEVAYDSAYISLTIETIQDGGGEPHHRAVVRPHGAVGVVALDEDDRILLVQQYRHPVGQRMLEIPAGTLDIRGEPSMDAAARELAEEADVLAVDWSPFLTLHGTPGYSWERWEVYIATDLTPVPADQRTAREAEEADMQQWWVPFEEAVEAVFDGRITDSMTVAAILGVQARRSR
ncbi:MAG: NUDIX hydrolase [Aeromicrobium sp.]